MKHRNPLAWFCLGAAVLLVTLGLAACGSQGFKIALPQVSQAQPTQAPTVVEGQGQAAPVPTTEPTAAPPAVDSPAPSPTAAKTATPAAAGVPALLKDFPLFGGAQADPDGAYTEEGRAGMLIHTERGPEELEIFYRQALAEAGWALRYSEGSAVGGFIQEWRRDQQFMTVEYHFVNGRPAVHVDLREINSQTALVVLMGFPLPNGTIVTNADGPSIELYVPQDYLTTREYFLTTMFSYGWKVIEVPLAERCATRSCGDLIEASSSLGVALQPVPTPDKQEAQSYYVTMPAQTRIRMTFQPHRENTRVFVDVNFTNPYRSWLPILPYPNSEVQAAMPLYMMLTSTDDFDAVLKYYEDSLYYYGWRQDPDAIVIRKKYEYSNAWKKDNKTLVMTLSYASGKTYVTLSCSRCTREQ